MEEVKDFHDMYNKNITILLSANRLYRTKQKSTRQRRYHQMTLNEKYNERLQLIEDTIALKPTDRVVNAIRVNYWPYLEYGMTLADALRDYDRGN